MSEIPKGLIPARYIGQTGFELGPDRKYYNVDGSLRTERTLSYGDELLMPEREVLGQTIVHDPHHSRVSEDLGPGHRVKAEHAGLSREELSALSDHDYDFQMPRVDFEPVEEALPADAKQEESGEEKPAESEQEKGG